MRACPCLCADQATFNRPVHFEARCVAKRAGLSFIQLNLGFVKSVRHKFEVGKLTTMTIAGVAQFRLSELIA